MRDMGGDVHRLMGEAVMVVFNKNGDQPDWPRFRVGVNSGEVMAGVLGDRGQRTYDIIGDTVNLAAQTAMI